MLTSLPETLRIEWNGGTEAITTVLDDVGYVASMRTVSGNDVVLKFQARFPGDHAYMWIRVESQSPGKRNLRPMLTSPI
jgi:hypothetical protein